MGERETPLMLVEGVPGRRRIMDGADRAYDSADLSPASSPIRLRAR